MGALKLWRGLLTQEFQPINVGQVGAAVPLEILFNFAVNMKLPFRSKNCWATEQYPKAILFRGVRVQRENFVFVENDVSFLNGPSLMLSTPSIAMVTKWKSNFCCGWV